MPGTDCRLRVGLLSDVHVPSADDSAARYYRKALECFRDREVDAVLVSGDLAIHGTIAELEAGARIWFDVFPDDKLPNGRKVVRLFCTGIHDDDGWIYGFANRFKTLDEAKRVGFYFHRREVWKRLYHEDWSPVFDKEVNGYRFILRNWVSIVGTESRKKGLGFDLADEQNPLPDWFAAHGGELPTDRPFFLVQHDPPRGGCNGIGFDDYITDGGVVKGLLEGRANAIALTGHSHISIGNESSIVQDGFTSVNLGTLCGFGFCFDGRENGHGNLDYEQNPPPEMKPISFSACRQGMIMEVYDDRIRFERREFVTDRSLGPDWVVPLGPGAAQPYGTATRRAGAPAPEFAAGAKVGVTFLEDGANRKGEKHPQVEVSFPTVNGANGGVRAFDYEVAAEFGIGDLTLPRFVKRVYSPGHFLPAAADTAPSACRFATRDFPSNQKVRFAVTPLNEWGRRGRTIRSDWKGN